MPKLPSEIISDILSRLPVRSLVHFKCVSKPWRSLISDPEFAKIHLKRTKEVTNVNPHHKIFLSTSPLLCIVDPESFCDCDHGNLLKTQLKFPITYPEYNYIYIFGSCNGLVCGLLESDQLINIWNPATRESREVGLPNQLDIAIECFYGFGYDSQLDDYKIIIGSRSTSSNSDHDGSKIEMKLDVFTLKSNVWRTVEEQYCCSVFMNGRGILANGVLHWLVTQQNGPTAMVSFDLVEEKFQEMVPLRGLTGDAIYLYYELGVFEDWLCLYSDGLSCEVWIMKEYSSEAETSWTSFWRFNAEPLPGGKYWLRPLWVTKNGNIFYDLDGRALVFYNTKEETSREFSIDHHESDWFESTVYIESLVSPNINGEFNGMNI